MALWRSGYAEVCKTSNAGSIPVGASNLFCRASGGTVYTRDLKSLALKGLWVQIPPRPPIFMTKVSHDSETNAHGQQVFTAVAFIHHQIAGVEKVFLPKRAATKKFLPDVFELPGGHIDFGEDMVPGLKREIKEEFGKEIKVGDPFAVFTYINPVKGSHSIEVIYFAQFIDGVDDIKLHPADHSEYRWVSEDELDSLPNREVDDPEIAAIGKGFALLRGEKINA